MTELRDKINQLPKADLHNHLHLGVDINFIRKRYTESNLAIPSSYDGLEGMINFIYSDVNKLLTSSDDAFYFMENSIASAIKDNVTYLEASVDINLSQYFNKSIEKLIDAVAELKKKYASKIDFRPDIGINKDLPVEQVYSEGTKCIDSGVFHGIDLYGREHNKRLDVFADIYKIAKDNSLKTKVHIGEFSSPETIEEAIELLNPDEIQHGIKAIDSEKTIGMLKDRNIRLNICPQSNIALGSVKNLSDHPIRKLYDQGVDVTLNSDDLLLFNATITDQCIALIENDIFSFQEIEKMIMNGIPGEIKKS